MLVLPVLPRVVHLGALPHGAGAEGTSSQGQDVRLMAGYRITRQYMSMRDRNGEPTFGG